MKIVKRNIFSPQPQDHTWTRVQIIQELLRIAHLVWENSYHIFPFHLDFKSRLIINNLDVREKSQRYEDSSALKLIENVWKESNLSCSSIWFVVNKLFRMSLSHPSLRPKYFSDMELSIVRCGILDIDLYTLINISEKLEWMQSSSMYLKSLHIRSTLIWKFFAKC